MKPQRKLAIIFDDLDKTSINKNIGLLAQLFAKNDISVEFITARLKKNIDLSFQTSGIEIVRIGANSSWPQLDNTGFRDYLRKNIDKYFAVILYRGRPYSKFVNDLADKNNVLTLLKLDSDDSISSFGKLFFGATSFLRLTPKSFYSKIHLLINLLSFVPSIKGFYLYDTLLFNSQLILSEKRNTTNRLKKITSYALYCPNSIPVNDYKVVEESLKKKQKSKENLIISVGRVVREKNFELGIRAFSLLPKNIKEKWKYEIIGPDIDSEYLKELREIIVENKLEKNVSVITGLYGRELFNKYLHASVLFMPYPNSNKKGYEGQPNVIVEGMFFGTAIIASNISGVRSLINNDEGVLLRSLNEKKISQKLGELIVNPSRRERFIKRSRDKVQKYFNLDLNGKSLLEVILELDYKQYIADQKSDSLALVPEVIETAVVRYLNFFTKKYDKQIDFKKAKILDVGCREFFSYDFFKKNYSNLISGIEIGNDALEFSKRKNIKELDIHFMDQKLKQNSYDIILSFHVFEHMYDLSLALNNCYNLLKRGGLLFFAIPMPAKDVRRSHWVNIPNRKFMDSLLTRAGFKLLYSKTHKENVFRNEPEMIGIFKKP